MTEDFMGFIQRHGVFVTAEELAIYGVDHMLLRISVWNGRGTLTGDGSLYARYSSD